jgi:phospholipid-transporting ATPase
MRKPKSVYVHIQGQSQEFEVLNVCEFNSTRKRMSTVIRMPDGKIKIYTKGADTVILERLSKNQPFTDKTLVHLEVCDPDLSHICKFIPSTLSDLHQDYATDGLRTLCLAYRDVSEQEYRQWSAIYDQAAATINGRGDALDQAAELIEKDLFLLGATAIEDKLQDGVPDTIHTLQMAGIKVVISLYITVAADSTVGLGFDWGSPGDGHQHWNVMPTDLRVDEYGMFISHHLGPPLICSVPRSL